jgi:hypothetical protein
VPTIGSHSAALAHVARSSQPVRVALQTWSFTSVQRNSPAAHAGVPHPSAPLAAQIVAFAQSPSEVDEVPSDEHCRRFAPTQ